MLSQRYEMQDVIGHGAMGEVSRAWDKLQGKVVALKRVGLASSGRRSEEARLALTHEFQLLSTLQHPNIIDVNDYGFDGDGRPFFTMPYLQQATDIVTHGHNQPLRAQLVLICQLLEALIYLHQHGLLHRDLKPANVLVTGDTVRVLDFGLATLAAQQQRPVGSVAYAAPEVLLGQPATVASDLYGVGVLAYELLFGRYPFDQDSPTLVEEIISAEPQPPSDSTCPVALQNVVLCLLAKEPNARFASALDTLKALIAAADMPLPTETATIRDSLLQAPRFVGRDAEIGTLHDAIVDVTNGVGSAFMLLGESGIGKSRLLDEVALYGLVSGCIVLRGQSVENDMPYANLVSMLRQLVLHSKPSKSERDALAPLVPDIDLLCDVSDEDARSHSAENLHERIYLTMSGLLSRLDRPVLLLLDDLQWAAASLDILSHISPLTERLPLMIVGGQRTDEGVDLRLRFPRFRPIVLERLQLQYVEQVAESILGQQTSTSQIASFLYRETEGNPFFLVETLRTLGESRERIQEITESTLPQTVFPVAVQHIVARRLAHLSAGQRRLVQLLALAGANVDRLVVDHLGEQLGLEGVRRDLATFVQLGILNRQSNGLHFSHDKLRIGIVATVDNTKTSAEYHLLATSIETLYPDEAAYFTLLATLWKEAGYTDRQVSYALKAARYASENYGNASARLSIEDALDIVPEASINRRFYLMTLLVRTLRRSRDAAATDVVLAQIDTLENRLNDAQRAEMYSLKFMRAYDLGAVDKFPRYLKLANHFAPPNSLVKAQALLYQSFISTAQAKNTEAQSAYEAAMALLARIEPDDKVRYIDLMTLGLTARSNIHAQMMQFELAAEAQEQAIALYDRHQLMFRKAIAQIQLSMIYTSLDRLKDAHDVLMEANPTIELADSLMHRVLLAGSLLVINRGLGKLDEAAENSAFVLSNSRVLASIPMMVSATYHRACVLRDLGQHDEALPLAHEAYEIAVKHQFMQIGHDKTGLLGDVYARIGKLDEAQAWYARSVEIAQQVGIPGTALQGHVGQAHVAALNWVADAGTKAAITPHFDAACELVTAFAVRLALPDRLLMYGKLVAVAQALQHALAPSLLDAAMSAVNAAVNAHDSELGRAEFWRRMPLACLLRDSAEIGTPLPLDWLAKASPQLQEVHA